MIDIIRSVISSVLLGIYQPCWFALITVVLFMFYYLYATDKELAGQGTKEAFKTWIVHFKMSKLFRRLFLLAFYTSLIVFRTLFNRNMWLNLVDIRCRSKNRGTDPYDRMFRECYLVYTVFIFSDIV